MRSSIAILAALIAASSFAKLPPLSEAQKADNAQKSAKTAYTDKVDAYKLCMAQDRVVAAYRKGAASTAKPAPVPVTTMTMPIAPPCADPGAYTPTTPMAQKPLEASGAHSPPGTATSPPSTSVPSGDKSQAPKQ